MFVGDNVRRADLSKLTPVEERGCEGVYMSIQEIVKQRYSGLYGFDESVIQSYAT